MSLPENEDLDRLFRSYREATEFGAASPNFMPLLWERIEARRISTFRMQRFARLFASGTVALAVLAGMVVALIPQNLDDDTWIEDLANNNLAQNTAYYDPVRLASPADLPPGQK